jgi:hypothetical protein
MDNYKQNRDITGYITCYKSDPNNNKHEGKPKKGGGSQASLTACTGKTETLAKSKPKLSWIEPFFELRLEALKHLFFDMSDVSELAPTSRVTAFGKALDLYNKFLPPAPACPGIFPADAVCKAQQFVSAGSWFPKPIGVY